MLNATLAHQNVVEAEAAADEEIQSDIPFISTLKDEAEAAKAEFDQAVSSERARRRELAETKRRVADLGNRIGQIRAQKLRFEEGLRSIGRARVFAMAGVEDDAKLNAVGSNLAGARELIPLLNEAEAHFQAELDGAEAELAVLVAPASAPAPANRK